EIMRTRRLTLDDGPKARMALRAEAANAGIADVFVLVDNEDEHALDFYRAMGGASSPVTAFTFSTP
ncbi:MAG: hypothetical protein ABI634_08850, partial [Acidobacteriota bacterium]